MRCGVFRWLHEAPFGLCRKFNQQTADGTKMGAYTELLRKVVSEITGLQEEKGIENLFRLGEVGSGSVLGLDDYSLAVKNPRLTGEQKLWSSGAKCHFVYI
ncbi:hypothetical protein HMPREF0578_0420 [Mobiluncus mulieris 28-1]|nr:hypothetical protein HMPREF0578_0420 [Mobiluncus mulieris 28-1]